MRLLEQVAKKRKRKKRERTKKMPSAGKMLHSRGKSQSRRFYSKIEIYKFPHNTYVSFIDCRRKSESLCYKTHFKRIKGEKP